jgi:hypothetical protein
MLLTTELERSRTSISCTQPVEKASHGGRVKPVENTDLTSFVQNRKPIASDKYCTMASPLLSVNRRIFYLALRLCRQSCQFEESVV